MPPLAPLSTVPDYKEHYMLLLSCSSLLLLLLLVGVALCAEECEEEEDRNNSEDRTLGSAGGTSPGGISPRGSSGATTPLTPLPKQNQSRTPVAATSSSSNLGTSPKIGSKNSNVKGGGGGGGGKSSLPPSKQRASKLFGNRGNAASVPSSSAEDSDKSDRKMVSMLFNVLSKNKVKGISLYKGGGKQQKQVTEGVAGGCRKF